MHGFACGTKTYLAHDDQKGYGLFAHVLIRRYEWIGHYTGVIISQDDLIDAEQADYLFALEDVGQSIDALRHGTCCRCINHDCKPNCETMIMAHNGQLCVLFRALRNIYPGQELTIDYNWRFDTYEEAQVS